MFFYIVLGAAIAVAALFIYALCCTAAAADRDAQNIDRRSPHERR